MTGGLVVVGASLAGVRTVEALRRRGYDSPITLIGAEPHPPYDRPPLSKEYLLGKLDEDALALRPLAAFAELEVELRLGVAATGLDLAGRVVELGAEHVPFDELVIATGSRPRRLPVPSLPGVHVLRTLDDAAAIRSALASGARVAVVGGGFIGAEVAHAARMLGLQVALVDPLPALMVRGLGPELGAVLARRHADSGVRLHLGRGVRGLDGRDRVERLLLDDGSAIATDLVVVGVGVEPAVDWLASSGLDATGGVAVDAQLRAAPGVYAVGDVARWGSGESWRRAEHWTNAVDQAAALAATMTGSPAPYEPLPYVWSDQLGHRLQVWGELRADDEIAYLHGGPAEEEFVAAAGRGGRLVGVVALGARREAMRAQRQLRAGAEWVA